MPRAKKLLLLTALAVVVLTLIVGLILFSVGSVDTQAVGSTLLARAGASLGLNLQADEIRFGVFRGLELDGFRAKGRLEAGKLDLEAEKLVLEPRLLPLLSGRVVITKATLEGPEIRLTRHDQRPGTGGKGKPAAQREERRRRKNRRRQEAAARAESPGQEPGDPGAATAGLDLEIGGLSIENADLELVSPGADQPTLRFEGLNIDLPSLDPAPTSERPILDATADGTFRAAVVAVPDLTGTDARGRLALAGGILRLTDLEMSHQLGPLEAREIEIDLAREPFGYSLDLGGGPLDTGQLLGAAPGGDMGASSLHFVGQGTGPTAAGLAGEGALEIAGGTLPDLQILHDLDRLLGSTDLVGTPYEPTTIGFRVTGDRIEIEPSRFESEEVRLDLEGWAEREGELSLNLVVSAPRGKIEIVELSQTVLDKLTDADGRTSLAFRIRGTRKNPRVLPDVPELTRSERERLEDEIKDALRDKLRELFGKDDND